MSGNTKQRLVDSALSLFADKGYHATTIQEIAAKACTNVAAINYHFQSKANFYAEVVISAMEVDKIEALEVEATAANAEQLLRDFIYQEIGEIDVRTSGALLTRIRAQEMAEPGPVLDILLEKKIRPLLGWLEAIITLLLPDGVDSSVVRRYTISVMSQVQMYSMEQIFLEKAYPDLVLDSKELERISAHLFNGTMAAIRAEHVLPEMEETR
jgi:AcrR family transcriptional regulator